MIETRRYYRPSAAAELIDVDVENVYGWIAAGVLKAVNVAAVGSRRARWRIADDELSRFLEGRSNCPPPASPPPRRRQRAADSAITNYF